MTLYHWKVERSGTETHPRFFLAQASNGWVQYSLKNLPTSAIGRGPQSLQQALNGVLAWWYLVAVRNVISLNRVGEYQGRTRRENVEAHWLTTNRTQKTKKNTNNK